MDELVEYDTCAFTDTESMKTAALLFDKICVFPQATLPSHSETVPHELVFSPEVDQLTNDNAFAVCDRLAANVNFNAYRSLGVDFGLANTKVFFRCFQEYYARKNITLIPVFSTVLKVDACYPSGAETAYHAMLDNLPVIDQKSSWEAVLECRRDGDSVRSFRAIRMWMDDVAKSSSQTEMNDKIGKKIREYQWAIQKHGLVTRNGYLTNLLKLENICTAASGSWLCSHLISQSPLFNGIVGTTLLLGRCYMSVRKTSLELEDIKRSNPELAYVAAITEKFVATPK